MHKFIKNKMNENMRNEKRKNWKCEINYQQSIFCIVYYMFLKRLFHTKQFLEIIANSMLTFIFLLLSHPLSFSLPLSLSVIN